MIIPILHVRKPRQQGVKYFSRASVVNQMAGQGFESDVLPSEPGPWRVVIARSQAPCIGD